MITLGVSPSREGWLCGSSLRSDTHTFPLRASMQVKTSLRYLEDRWDEQVARSLDDPALLRSRSNLLGSDLRITNFGGGNTSSKIQQTDPLDGIKRCVLWIKGSGGDIGSMQKKGF